MHVHSDCGCRALGVGRCLWPVCATPPPIKSPSDTYAMPGCTVARDPEWLKCTGARSHGGSSSAKHLTLSLLAARLPPRLFSLFTSPSTALYFCFFLPLPFHTLLFVFSFFPFYFFWTASAPSAQMCFCLRVLRGADIQARFAGPLHASLGLRRVKFPPDRLLLWQALDLLESLFIVSSPSSQLTSSSRQISRESALSLPLILSSHSSSTPRLHFFLQFGQMETCSFWKYRQQREKMSGSNRMHGVFSLVSRSCTSSRESCTFTVGLCLRGSNSEGNTKGQLGGRLQRIILSLFLAFCSLSSTQETWEMSGKDTGRGIMKWPWVGLKPGSP